MNPIRPMNGLHSVFCTMAVAILLPLVASPQKTLSANDRMAELGPEGQALGKRVGTWDVTFTDRSKPGAAPVTTERLVAEREMIGPMLQERLHPLPEAAGRPGRVSTTSRTAASMAVGITCPWTRGHPFGLMHAYNLGRDPADRIFVSFIPFTTPREGQNVTGQMLRMEQVIVHVDDDHEEKNQYFTPADGVATKWLAKRYSYTRRK